MSGFMDCMYQNRKIVRKGDTPAKIALAEDSQQSEEAEETPTERGPIQRFSDFLNNPRID